jgi:hypothetical protein
VARPEVTGRGVRGDESEPIALTFAEAQRLTGLGLTTLWRLGREKRIRLVQAPGVRRTLIDYSSLRRLFTPAAKPQNTPRRDGRLRKPAVSP